MDRTGPLDVGEGSLGENYLSIVLEGLYEINM